MPITFEKAARVYQSGSASHSEDLRLVLFVKNRLATSKRSITSTLMFPAVKPRVFFSGLLGRACDGFNPMQE